MRLREAKLTWWIVGLISVLLLLASARQLGAFAGPAEDQARRACENLFQGIRVQELEYRPEGQTRDSVNASVKEARRARALDPRWRQLHQSLLAVADELKRTGFRIQPEMRDEVLEAANECGAIGLTYEVVPSSGGSPRR